MRKIIYTKSEVLELFSRKIPNADKMLLDLGRDILTVQFGQYSKDYKASDILNQFVALSKGQGVEIVFE